MTGITSNYRARAGDCRRPMATYMAFEQVTMEVVNMEYLYISW